MLHLKTRAVESTVGMDATKGTVFQTDFHKCIFHSRLQLDRDGHLHSFSGNCIKMGCQQDTK